MRAISQVGSSLTNRIQQAKDHFIGMIDVASGQAKEHDRRAFLRAYNEDGVKLSSRTASFSKYESDLAQKKNKVSRLAPIHLGKMFMYRYDPYHAKTLPYYDMLPLILLMDIRNDGFLGLNLHYLPPKARALLLDAIVDNELRSKRFSKNPESDEQERIKFSYQIMKRAAKSNLYKPCVKSYLFKQVISTQFIQVPGEDWETVLFLPFDRFRKADRKTVWRDSLNTR